MLKRLTFLLFWFVLVTNVSAQTDSLYLINRYGGLGADYANSVVHLSNGHLLLVGSTTSSNGFLSGNNGNYDGFALEIDTLGVIIWAKNYGDAFYNAFVDAVELSDGSIMICGQVSSDSLNFNKDIWVLKIDANGNILESKTHGGSFTENVKDICLLQNDHVLICGDLRCSNDTMPGGYFECFDDTTNVQISPFDGYLLELDESGDEIWKEHYGGSLVDDINGILPLSNGNILCFGNTRSSDFQLSSNVGTYDAWAFLLDADHNIIWNQTYGGTEAEFIYRGAQKNDGTVYLCGRSNSVNGVMSANNGLFDVLVLQIDEATGELIWSKNFGGSGEELPYNIYDTENGFVVSCFTTSGDGEVPDGPSLSTDSWIFEAQTDGNIIRHWIIRDTLSDTPIRDSGTTFGNNIFVSRISTTPPNDLPADSLSANIYFYKREIFTSTSNVNFSDKFELSPNPASQSLFVSTNTNIISAYKVTDLLGCTLFKQLLNEPTNRLQLDVSTLPTGTYNLSIRDKSGSGYNTLFQVFK